MELNELIEFYQEKCEVLNKAMQYLYDANHLVNSKTISDEIMYLKKEFNIANETVIMLYKQKEVNG